MPFETVAAQMLDEMVRRPANVPIEKRPGPAEPPQRLQVRGKRVLEPEFCVLGRLRRRWS